MLEPTIIRQTATLTEWDGKQGYATADNGKVYPLNINNMEGDIFGRLPEKGARVELYLHQNERGETEFVTCRAMPSFDNQGGFALPNPYATEGRKFFADYQKTKRFYLNYAIANLLFLLSFLVLGKYDGDWLKYDITLLLFTFYLLMNFYHWWRQVRQPENSKCWIFTLHNNGLAFNYLFVRKAPPNGKLPFTSMQSISLEKSKIFGKSYWCIQCHDYKLGKIKIPLDSLSDSELEQANLLLKQYLANYPEVSLCL